MNAVLVSLGIALLSFSGVLFLSLTRVNVNKKIKTLLAFAGGVILATAVTLSIEGFHLVNPLTALLCILGGFVGMFLIQKILPETHHHHESNCEHTTPQGHGIKMLIGDSIHNIADGIIIAVTFHHSLELGLVTALGIAVHEFTQEVSEYFVLRDAGFSNRKALTLNFLTALTILIGVGIGFVTSENLVLQAILLSVSAGVFFQIAFQDIISFRDFLQLRHREARNRTLLFLLGAGIIVALGILTPHSHDHHEHSHSHGDHSHHDEHDHEEHAPHGALDSGTQINTIEDKVHTHEHHHDHDH